MKNDFKNKYYTKSIESTVKDLDSNLEKGLSQEVAKSRLNQFGSNKLEEKKRPGFFSKLIAQFSDFLVLILIVAAIISFLVGERTDAVVIIAIVIINAFLGIYQEGKAEKSLDSLKKMTTATAKVIRDGTLITIEASELVPGDIISLDAGDIIPADIRWIESSNLQVEESSLTGESIPVEKNACKSFDENASLGDRVNMGYMSTIITYGRGKGIVVGTGHDTEIGKIATMIQSYDEELTPLQKQLNQLGKVLGITTIIICIIVFIIGLLQGREMLDMFLVSISLAVAAIPEGLPAIVTIVLSIGMNRMVEKNAIVKKLLAVETLGATTVICSDKTGTLTQNEMTVVKTFVDGKILDITGEGYEPVGDFLHNGEIISPSNIGDLETLLAASVLSNDAILERKQDGYNIIGDPTEGALVTFAEKANYNRDIMHEEYNRVAEIPFDSDRKMMTTFHENYIPNNIISFTKGAPDIIVDRCVGISRNGKVKKMTTEDKDIISKANSEFSQSALRVLSFAYKTYDELPKDLNSDIHETDMIFLGLIGMIDPARPEAKKAIEKCKTAGIRTVMITGDYRETAFAIAKNLGVAENESETIMGHELDNYTDDELKDIVDNINVYARVSPQHKVRIIEALKANGEITSMTGDGVNDSLALKRADIGVAMGVTGTDVAKNTADMILTDDNFASIVAAVEEGRVIYSNIKKFVFFLLSCNIGEIFLVLSSILLNLPIPLIPIQLLWLNLVTDSFPALALGVEKGEPDIMKEPPREPSSPIVDKMMMIRIMIQAVAIGGVSLISFKYGLTKYPLAADVYKARTLVFVTLITAELLRAYSSRSDKYSIFKLGVFSNKQLVHATIFSFILLVIVIYVPFLQPIFHTYPLDGIEWIACIGLAFIPLIVGEITKKIINK